MLISPCAGSCFPFQSFCEEAAKRISIAITHATIEKIKKFRLQNYLDKFSIRARIDIVGAVTSSGSREDQEVLTTILFCSQRAP
jgi:hypothetical protein